jgi:hypothetical protein
LATPLFSRPTCTTVLFYFELMKDLFFSEVEKTAFWIAGYTNDDQGNVNEIIKSLKGGAKTFAEWVGCEIYDVSTFVNNKPPRYQYMRVYYAKTELPPEGAFILDDKWTMLKWIEY